MRAVVSSREYMCATTKIHGWNTDTHVGTLCDVTFILIVESSLVESSLIIDIEYNKRLDRQRPCLEGDFSGGSNNIVQSNKSV